MPRSDGVSLIYPAREHTIVAETGAGKSWVACMCALAEMRKGNRVVYIHYEEADPAITIERLMFLGAGPEMILKLFTYVGPLTSPRKGRLKALWDRGPSLVIHDGVNQAMSTLNAEHLAVNGASVFRTTMVVPCVAAGAATLACERGTEPGEFSPDNCRHG